VTGTDYKAWIEILDAASGESVLTFVDPDPTAVFNSVRWSPDGKRLLTTGGSDEIGSKENPVIVWDGKTGEKLLSIVRHAGQVWWGTWSPNGQRIVTGSTDDTTRIWDASSGSELLTLSTPNDWEVAPEWSPDGQFIAVGAFSLDGSAASEVWRVWQSTEELIAYAKECCVFRQLTAQEREQFGLPPGP
jgi:WD40 repeat protein